MAAGVAVIGSKTVLRSQQLSVACLLRGLCCLQIKLVKKSMKQYSKESKLESADHRLDSSKVRRG